MPISKTKIGKKGGKSSEAPAGATWDQKSGPDEYDGRENKAAGSKGKEPGGRWSPAYYETPAVIIGPSEIRKP